MKRILLVFGVFLAGIVNGQNYTRDAGIRLGDYFSVTCRQFMQENQAIEGMIFIGRQGANITLLKEFFQPALGHLSDNFVFQYGYGVHVGFRHTDHYRVLNRTYELEESRFSPLIGINGLAGLEYHFPTLPFLVSVDVKPYFEYSTIQIFSIYLQSIGFAIKYKF